MKPALRILGLGLPTALALISGCGFDDRIAGGTSSEVPNALHGQVLDTAGHPVAGCAVRLASTTSWFDSLDQYDSTTTDSSGRWQISRRQLGTRTLLLRTAASGSLAEITLGTTSLLRHDTLKALTWVRGRVLGARGPAAIAILGTGVSTETDSLGNYLIGPIPAGMLRLQIIADSAGTALRKTIPVQTTPGDTGLAETLQLSPWFLEAYGTWAHSRTATLDLSSLGANIPGDHIGFPIPLRLDTLLDLKATRPGELRFANEQGIHLPFQIENWDSTGGKALVWVQLDTANGSSAKHSLRMYWGKPGALPPPDMPPVFAVANGYRAAWHLGADPETSLHETLLWQNSNTGPGWLGKAQTLLGNGSYNSDSQDLGGPQSWTVSLWVKLDKKPSGEILLAGFSDGPDSTRWGLSVRDDQVVRVWSGADTNHSLESPTALALGIWTHLAASFEATTNRIGLVIDSSSLARRSIVFPKPSRQRLRGGLGLEGSLDELDLATTVRSPEWSALERQVATPGTKWLRWQ